MCASVPVLKVKYYLWYTNNSYICRIIMYSSLYHVKQIIKYREASTKYLTIMHKQKVLIDVTNKKI